MSKMTIALPIDSCDDRPAINDMDYYMMSLFAPSIYYQHTFAQVVYSRKYDYEGTLMQLSVNIINKMSQEKIYVLDMHKYGTRFTKTKVLDVPLISLRNTVNVRQDYKISKHIAYKFA